MPFRCFSKVQQAGSRLTLYPAHSRKYAVQVLVWKGARSRASSTILGATQDLTLVASNTF